MTLLPVHAAPGAARLERERDVFRDGQMREERGLLINHRDAQRTRSRGIHVLDRTARHRQRAAVGLFRAGDDLDERGFARAVLADDRVHLAGPQIERDAFERTDAGEGLLDGCGVQEQRGRLGHLRANVTSSWPLARPKRAVVHATYF